ncbi:hypothetical protein BJV77DRAFT_965941 [Russula vinacea]|nr:hypothetical protein BJV77DRAFT_965941 [Russula vinacea]
MTLTLRVLCSQTQTSTSGANPRFSSRPLSTWRPRRGADILTEPTPYGPDGDEGDGCDADLEEKLMRLLHSCVLAHNGTFDGGRKSCSGRSSTLGWLHWAGASWDLMYKFPGFRFLSSMKLEKLAKPGYIIVHLSDAVATHEPLCKEKITNYTSDELYDDHNR